MTEITRRRFIEATGLAAAIPPLAAAQSAGQAQTAGPDRASAPRATSRARDLTDAELEAMFRRCSNAGRWGPNDELGTLNYITPAKRVAAAGLVKTGEVVSAGRDLSTRQSKTNAQPVVHMMMFSAANSPSAGDYFTIAPHGMVVTHMDALCHFSWKDQLYNGRKRSETLTRERRALGVDLRPAAGHLHARRAARRRRRARRAPGTSPTSTSPSRISRPPRSGSACESSRAMRSSSAPAWSAWRRSRASRTSIRAPACTPSARSGCTTPGVGVRRRLHREAALPERELHAPPST